MTARLIGFMAVLLFLSLAAFGLLMNQSRDAVLAEVRRTVSTVGTKTLAAFTGKQQPFADGAVDLKWIRAVDADFDMKIDKSHLPPTGPEFDKIQARMRDLKKDMRPGVNGAFVVIRMEQHRDGPPPAGTAGAADGAASQPAAPITEDVEITTASAPADAAISFDPCNTSDTMMFVASDSLRVEGGKDENVRVGIPVFRAEGTDASLPKTFFASAAPASAPALGKTEFEELVFQVPTTEYQDLFNAFAKRSLFAFLGVFMVGTVLSAGIARRFTRPIRRLDDGIRRVSDGALDVRVAEEGGAEVARLARAFNEMAGRLEAARAREHELNRRDKLAALGRLAAGVAHDVRNPLQSINLTLQHLDETGRPEAPEKVREFTRALGLIRSEIRRLDDLVANFLRFARSDHASLGPVAPAALLEETAALVKKEAERRRIEVRIDVGADVPDVEGSGESLRSALLNLVLNGFEAMPDGGALLLAAKRSGAGRVELSVSDTGCGIPETDRERVFEFGFTTRDQGHGLGLAMVHHVIVEEHGGRIQLESEEGRGTTIRFELEIAGDARVPEVAA